MDWNCPVEVYVTREPHDYERKRCEWLGHSSYRCGNCRKHFVRVRDKDDHDKECPGCGWHVMVRRTQG